MAIDTKDLSQLITDFRALNAKDSITPENLGYILQRLADLIATAGTSDALATVQELLTSFRTAGYALTSIKQGQSDRNHIYATIGKVNLSNGSTSSATSVFIQQATTERAGAMRAQQVIDLNGVKRDVTAMLKDIASNKASIATLVSNQSSSYNNAQIACIVKDGALHVMGAQKLVEAGYVPYIFRCVRKRNRYKDFANDPDEDRKYSAPTKGWSLFGSRHSVRLSGTEVQFTTSSHKDLSKVSTSYSSLPRYFVHTNINGQGIETVAWGRSIIELDDYRKAAGKKRMIKLRFAIGFAKPIDPGRAKITPANLVSSLAEFAIIYNSAGEGWHFARP